VARLVAEWEANDWKGFQRKLSSAHRNIDSRPLFEMYERRFRGYMIELFDSEGAAGGSRWKTLSSNYIAWKGHSTIGILTGDMRESLTGGSGYTHRMTKTKLTIGQRPGAVPYTKHFSRVRPIAFSQGEHRLWGRMAKQFYAEALGQVFNPHAQMKSVRTPDGQLYTVDRSGKARIRNIKGQFVTKAAAKLGFAAVKGR
jgi:hypothetical protein